MMSTRIFALIRSVVPLNGCTKVCWRCPVFSPASPCIFIHREYAIYLDRPTKVYSLCPMFLATESTWSCWIDPESCAHRISLFFSHRKYVISLNWCGIVCSWNLPILTHRKYVISLDQCRIVCSWNLPGFPPQKVRDLVGLMQNCVLMGSPHVSPKACMWSCWIDAELCADGISLCFTHSLYVILLDKCRIMCSGDPPMFYPQLVCDLVGSMQKHVLMESPCFLLTESTGFVGSMQNCLLMKSPCFSPTGSM